MIVGVVVLVLAAIGAVRVVKVTLSTSRRMLARAGRALARLEPAHASAPADDMIAEVASLAAARSKRARKAA